ncbi:putative TBP domain superfamily, beta-adaptin appendage subdomain-containing protein [Plasmopara halstedii]
MRFSNFRHDKCGAQIVEISREEYERTKRSILRKIRRRLIILGVIIGSSSIVAFILGGVICIFHANILKFHIVSGHVTLANLYFMYAATSLTFSLHGFFINAKWQKMQRDGNRMIMHLQTATILGVGSCAIALWLGIATLSAFGFVEVKYITSSDSNLIYLTTLILVTVHLVISPWLLCTIYRKGSQADKLFGAEFLSDFRQSREHDLVDDDSSDEGDAAIHSAAIQPIMSSLREQSEVSCQWKSRQQVRNLSRNHEGIIKAGFNTSSTYLQSLMNEDDDKDTYSERRRQSALAAFQKMSPSIDAVFQIPTAPPVSLMASNAEFSSFDFWQFWKQIETTGGFSCTFTNQPSRADIERHLKVNGFDVVAIEQKNSVLQVHFYGTQHSTGVIFLCEFVVLLARRFFQVTFKSKVRLSVSM